MDIRDLILREIKIKGKITVNDIIKRTGFSRAYLGRFLQSLREEGKIVLAGKGKNSFYLPSGSNLLSREKRKILAFRTELKNENLQEDQVLENIRQNTGI